MFNLFSSKKKAKPIEITDQNFNELILNSEKPILLDFYATWCNPCHVMLSLINRMAKEDGMQEIAMIGIVDIDANRALAKHFEIKSVPTLIFIYNNKVYDRQNGLLPYPILKEKLEKFAEDVVENE